MCPVSLFNAAPIVTNQYCVVHFSEDFDSTGARIAPKIRDYLAHNEFNFHKARLLGDILQYSASNLSNSEIIQKIDLVDHLQQFYSRNPKPEILNGIRFIATHKIATGGQGVVLLARREGEEEDGNRYVLKIPLSVKKTHLKRTLYEYMLQQHAYSLLKGTCTVPEPIGLIKKRIGTSEAYIQVGRFQAMYPGATASIQLVDAMRHHRRCPLLTIRQWRDVCLSLITAFETLQANDIYHNDIKPNNILLRFYENNVEPVIIDFGLASRSNNHMWCKNADGTISFKRKRTEEERLRDVPYICPILCQQKNPIPTCDLFSVVYMIEGVATCVQLPTIASYCDMYVQYNPLARPGFQEVFDVMKKYFHAELHGGVVVEEREGNVMSYTVSKGK